jgi:hypothetical protein
VRFTGTPTLTHNATSLILPTGANIVVQAGDTAQFTSDASGNWRCVWYQRASGYSLASGSGDTTGAASSTNNAAARFDSTTGKILKNSALIIEDTTGALSRTGGGGISVQGTNTNDNAASGYIGEVISSNLPVESAISLTTSTVTNVTSVTLTAGDWDISGQCILTFTGTPIQIISNLNTTSATLGTAGPNSPYSSLSTTYTTGATQFVPVPTGRLNLSTTTTLYLLTFAVFPTGTSSAYGWIHARRMR